jgi:hypothetical protein
MARALNTRRTSAALVTLLLRPQMEEPDRVSLAKASTSPVLASLNVTSTPILPAPSTGLMLGGVLTGTQQQEHQQGAND